MDNSYNAPISAGDVVTLKSGGPTMTVEGIEKHPANAGIKGFKSDEQIRTLWFDATGAKQEALFWPHVLILDAKAAEAKNAERKAAADRAKQLSDDAEAKRQADDRAATGFQAKEGQHAQNAPFQGIGQSAANNANVGA
jgi:uncharacterized protein YodC (DUF2158 family)